MPVNNNANRFLIFKTEDFEPILTRAENPQLIKGGFRQKKNHLLRKDSCLKPNILKDNQNLSYSFIGFYRIAGILFFFHWFKSYIVLRMRRRGGKSIPLLYSV
jgi:hypothetical protein